MSCSSLTRILLLALFVPMACPAAPLATLHDIRALTNQDAAQNPFVSFEASVIYYKDSIHDLNLQDGTDGIFVRTTESLKVQPGDRVRIEGRLMPSFLPYLAASHVQVLRHGTLPAPLPVTFDDLVRTRVVSIRVRAHGRIRAADLVNAADSPSGRLQLAMDGGFADVEVDSSDLAALRGLVDCEVEVIGTAGRKFDGKMQQTGVRIRPISLSDIHILKRPAADPWSLPPTPLEAIISGYHVDDRSSRLRVRGILTYFEPGMAAVLQSGSRSLWIQTASTDRLEIGDEVDVIGFPAADEGRLTLNHAELRPTGSHLVPEPIETKWNELAAWARNTPSGHGFDLVAIEAAIVSQVRTDHEDRYVLDAGGSIFSAVIHHLVPHSYPPPMRRIPPGSRVRVTGICWIAAGSPVKDQVPFDILLRTPADIILLQGPPLWSVRNLAIALIVVFVFLLLLAIYSIGVEHKARLRSAAAAELERRQRTILEKINAMHPLADIVEEITTVVSLELKGAPCWCSIAGGATLGSQPNAEERLRTIQHPVPARTGGLLGSLYVALPPNSRHPEQLEEALSLGAELIAVALETRRLYTDLVHRSEFDQLTGLYNRAALDQKVQEQIHTARSQGSIFALLYIDFNDFKKINDTHGHHVGDQFLEEAARRMKSQLRPCDLLARLGGDEFAVLVTSIRNREEVDEVTTRLHRALAEPFVFGSIHLPGSAAAGIAIYPEDGTTESSLLSHADAAMYADKAERKRWQGAS